MSTTAETFGIGIGREKSHESSVTEKINPRQYSDLSYESDDAPMTKAEREELAELREMVHQLAASATLNARSAPQVQVQTQPPSNGMSAWARTFVTIAVVLIGWIFTALYIAKSTETEIRVSNAILTEQLKQTRLDFDEYRRITDRDMKLADERYRQMSIDVKSMQQR
jgi:hypothetical protein